VKRKEVEFVPTLNNEDNEKVKESVGGPYYVGPGVSELYLPGRGGHFLV